MEGKTELLIKSTAADAGGRHEICRQGRGLLRKEENGWHLRCTARDESGGRSGWDIRLRDSAVTVRSMTGGYTMDLEPGRTTAMRLSAGGQDLTMEIETHSIRWALDDENRGRIELNYTMCAAGEKLSDISLQIQLRKNKENKP